MRKTKIKNLILCGIFAAITSLIAPISIPLGPIPISLGLFAVMLTGTLLKPIPAAISQIIYLLIGSLGLPVFTGFIGGIQKLAGPTGGYLAVYPIMAFVISYLMSVYDKHFSSKGNLFKAIWIMTSQIIALVICYAAGCAWFMLLSGTTAKYAASVTIVPFIAFDILKTVCVTIITLSIRHRLNKY